MVRRWILLSIGLILAASSLPGQIPAAPDRTLVYGLVTEFGTGEPLAGITVSLTPTALAPSPDGDLSREERLRVLVTRRSARSDPDGRFEIDAVEPGEYYLQAERRGFIRPDEIDPRGTRLAVPGDTLGVLGLELLPGATIEGHAFDEEGQPIQGVQVVAQTWTYGPRGRVLRDVTLPLDPLLSRGGGRIDTTITDAEGAYRLAGLMPDQYQVVARRRTRAEAPGDDTETGIWGPVYYPSTDRADGAGRIHVDRGARVSGVNFTWKPVPTITIRGQVAGAPGTWDLPALLEEESLKLALAETGGESAATLGVSVTPGGRFEIHAVGSRSYVLTASIDGPDVPGPYVGQLSLDVGDSDEEDVVVTVHAPERVMGRIIPASATPGGFQMSQLRVGLIGIAPGASDVEPVPVGPDGTFAFESVARSDYHVELHGLPAGMYLESGRYGFADPLRVRFRPGDDPGATLELRIAASPGRITGTSQPLRDRKFRDARLSLVPQGIFRERYDLYRTVDADSEGAFFFEDVAPGNYRVFAWNIAPDPYALMDTWFLLPFEGLGTFVEVEAAGEAEADPALIVR